MAARNFVSSVPELEEDESLGERVNQLVKLSENFLVPQAFIVKPQAYLEFLTFNKLNKKIKHLLGTIDSTSSKSLRDTSKYIKRLLRDSVIPTYILNEIISEYKKMGGVFNHAKVSVYSSTSGSTKVVKQVKGDSSLIHTIKEIWTCLYSSNHNPTIVVEKSINGKRGKIRTTTKLIKTFDELSSKDRENLEKLVDKFKKEFYFPHEIDWLINDNKIYVLKIRPETNNDSEISFPEINYSIIRNSVHTL